MSFSDFWDSLGSTVKSIGGAVKAASGAGLALDLTHSVFDDKDDTFGDYLNMLAKSGGDIVDPLLNHETLTGKAFGKLGHGIETVFREGVSEPLVSGLTVAQGAAFGEKNPFNAETWSKAYDIAQGRSIGQVGVLGAMQAADMVDGGGDTVKTFRNNEYDRLHKQLSKQGGLPGFLGDMMTVQSGVTDFAANFFLDPTIVAGKGLKVLKAGKTLRKITAADDAKGIGALMDTEVSKRVLGFQSKKAGLKTRTEAVIGDLDNPGFIDGKNAAQIKVGLPELARSTRGAQLASLLADTNKLTDPSEKIKARQRILRVAYGDETAVGELKGEMAALDDQLTNIQKGGVLDLEKAMVADTEPALFYAGKQGEQVRYFDSPELLADAERQIMNQQEAVKFLDNERLALKSILDVESASRTATLHVSRAGKRSLARAEGETLLRGGQVTTGFEAYDKAANRGMDLAKRFAQTGAIETVFQRGPMAMPLRVVKKLYVDTPVNVVDALKTSRLQGIVNLHDVDGTGQQLNSMMHRAKLAPNEAMKLQSEFMGARTEADRMRTIARVETASIKNLAKKYAGVDLDSQRAVDDFVTELSTRGRMRRDSMAAALNGRAYSATKLEKAAKSMGDDDANWREMRIDQIDDDGVPVSLPILETQGANLVPLLDVDHAEKMLKREGSRLSKLAKAWQAERFEFDRLSRQKAAGGFILEDALDARRRMADGMVEVGEELTRMWKFSVLARLGYPLRILADDHMRIWAKIGAMSMYAPMTDEVIRNFGYNQVRRRRAMHARRIGLVGRIKTLDDLIGDDEHLARFRDTKAEIKSIDRKLAKLGDSDPTVEGLRAHRNALSEMVGDDMDELVRERDELVTLFENKEAWQGELPEELASKAGVDPKAVEKRHMGERPLTMAGGYTLDGALGGVFGPAVRKTISSDETFQMNLLDSEAKVYRSMSSGSWRTIQPDEAGHLSAWEWAVNKQLRQSKVANQFIQGKTVDDVVRWLKTTEGKALRQRLPWHTADPEAYAHRVKAMVDEYVPEGSVRDAARSRNVRRGDLQAHVGDDVTKAPAVHGGIVDTNLGVVGGVSGVINKSMSRVYRYISEMPTDKASRHPFFMAMYRQEVRDLGKRKVAQAKREGRDLSSDDLNEITRIARERARHELKRTLFDMSAHSNAAHTMRFMSPFFSAHQEGLQRWYRLASDDPSVVRRFTQGFNMPREAGLVVDQDGNAVKAGDPISSDHMIVLPRAVTKLMGFPADEVVTMNENSFNLVLQGGLTNPGFGPLAQLPVEYAAKRWADKEAIVKLAETMNPIRPDGAADILLPATVRRVWSAVQGEKSGEFAYYYSRTIADEVAQFQMDKGRMPTRTEFARIEKHAKTRTTAIAWLRVGQNLLSPAPATPQGRFAVQRDAWHRLQDEARVRGGSDADYARAENIFLDKYGPAFFPLMESTSNNPAGMDATAQTVAAIKRNRALLDLLPARLHKMVVGPEAAGGEYSGNAAAWLRSAQIKPGDPETYYSSDNPAEAGMSGMVSKGWTDYNKAMAGLNAQAYSMGLASYRDSEQLTAMKGQVVDALAKRNFAWWDDYNDFNPNEYETWIAGMRTVAGNKRLSRDTARGDVHVLKQYLNIRSGFQQMLAMRKRMGGSDSPDANSNADLMMQYGQSVSQLVESNTMFERHMYNGVIEHDPLLVDTPVAV